MDCKASALLYDNLKMSAFSAHTLGAVSKGQAYGTAILRVSPRIWGLLIWVGDTRNQGYGWSSYESSLSVCASNEDGGGYHASMISRDHLGFYCDCCGTWVVSTMSRGAGMTSSCFCEPCENMFGSWARFANTGHGGYVYSEHEPLLAVFPYANDHARVGEQLFQCGLPTMDELAAFETEVTSSLPIYEGPFADNLGSSGALGPNDFIFHYDLFASTDSLVLPEQTIRQASAPMAMSGHRGHTFDGISDVPIQRSGKRRAVCPITSCGATFSRQSDVPRHIDTAHGSKERHFCDFPGCKKSFSRHDKVTGHKREHDPEGQLGLGMRRSAPREQRWYVS